MGVLTDSLKSTTTGCKQTDPKPNVLKMEPKKAVVGSTELLQTETENRFVIFPLNHGEIFQNYKDAAKKFWTPSKFNFIECKRALEKMDKVERAAFDKCVCSLTFAHGYDSVNYIEDYAKSVPILEARFFFGWEVAMEGIHTETFKKIFGDFVQDTSISTTSLRKLAGSRKDWCNKWIGNPNVHFGERTFALAVAQNIFNVGGFAALLGYCESGLFRGLKEALDTIFEDQRISGSFAVLLTTYVSDKPSGERVLEMVKEVVAIEQNYLKESLMGPKEVLLQHVEFVADHLLKELNIKPHFGRAENIIGYMKNLNFNHRAVKKAGTRYQAPTARYQDNIDDAFDLDADF
uniref:Ribonucleoside-diphosphate reductase subunit M2 n=1 Tax=Rhabditophanes sp. KR3021 TaxID=114890 RepID=A0AC35U1Z9_9BILA